MSQRFHFGNRLFGRTSLLEQLQRAYSRICRGDGEVLTVYGHSGAGKTSLVMGVRQDIEERGGWFVSGKFDQYQRTLPYYAIAQALRQVWATVDSSPPRTADELKRKLAHNLGENIHLLVELIPQMASDFGDDHPGENIGLGEARHRFARTIGMFLEVVCSPEHPVVLFVDDWQWADDASIELLKQLDVGNRLRYLLLIAAYRDEEVGATHPLQVAIEHIRRSGRDVETVSVTNLSRSDVASAIHHALPPRVDAPEPLAEMVYSQTRGNPFHMRTLLEFLIEREVLVLDPQAESWRLRRLEETVPATIVDLFGAMLSTEGAETNRLLSLAACLGNRFDLQMLAVSCALPPAQCRRMLAPLIDRGLLLPLRDGAAAGEADGLPQRYRFLHDRVQQAAFQLIPPLELAAEQLEIGRMLMGSFDAQELAEQIFEVVGHLNEGAELVTEPAELLTFIALNLQAANKARAGTAYESMLGYHRQVAHYIDRLPGGAEGFWRSDYERCLDFYKARAESEFVAGDRPQAQAILEDAIGHAKTPLERAEIRNILIVQLTLQARYPEAIAVGREALVELGIELPEGQFDVHRDAQIHQVLENLGDRPVASLASDPLMTDPEVRMATRLLITMGPPCYRTHQRLWSVLVPTVVRLTLQYGLMPQVGYSHTAFGGLLCWTSDRYELARQFGELAERIMESRFTSPSDQSVFYLMVGSSTRHWFKHLKSASMDYDRAYQIGLSSGNLQYAAYAFGHNMYCKFFQGIDLDALLLETRQSLKFSKTRHNQWAIDLLTGGIGIFGALSDPQVMEHLASWEAHYLKTVDENQNIQVRCIYLVLRAFTHYCMGQYRQALGASDKAEEIIYTVGTQGLLPWPEHRFIRLLTLAALADPKASNPDAAGRRELAGITRQLSVWALQCPENHEHKHQLALAEQARLEGRVEDAAKAYDNAIAAARANGFQQWAGVASECAFRFWEGLGLGPIAQRYWEQAYEAFYLWGAQTKVDQLEERLRVFLSDAIEQSTREYEQEIRPSFCDDVVGEQFGFLRAKAQATRELHEQRSIATIANELAQATEKLRTEVSQRKKAEEALTQSELRFRTIFEKSADPILLLEGEKFIDCNAAAVRLLGKEGKEGIKGVSPAALGPEFQPDGRPSAAGVREHIAHATREGVHRFEWVYSRKDGSPLPVEVTLTAIPFGQGNLIHTVWRDLTEQKAAEERQQRTEEQLRQSQKLQAVGTLAGGIAHEFNNMLSAIMGYTELTLDVLERDSEASENLEESYKAAQRAKELVTQILTFSRKTEMAKSHVDAQAVVGDVVRLLQQTSHKSITMETEIDSSIPPVFANATQLHQVLLNLGTNACHAIGEEGGRICFGLSRRRVGEPPRGDSQGLREGDYALFTVSDTGAGIPGEAMAHIFEPFYTTKEVGQGSGMGLAVVHGIVTQHAGSISAESTPGAGSRFEVLLPLAPETLRQEGVPHAAGQRVASVTPRKKILFVDDEPALAKLGKKLLQLLGCEVVALTSPEEALEILKGTSPEAPIDLLITDLSMPAMTGYNLAKCARALDQELPIMICTGYHDSIDDERLRGLGISCVLKKPLSKDVLHEAVAQQLRVEDLN